MLVRDRMTKHPVTVTCQDTLAMAHEKMLPATFATYRSYTKAGSLAC